VCAAAHDPRRVDVDYLRVVPVELEEGCSREIDVVQRRVFELTDPALSGP
jgi:hypothetical protein